MLVIPNMSGVFVTDMKNLIFNHVS